MTRLVTVCVWALAMGSAAFWALQHLGAVAADTTSVAVPAQISANAAPSEELAPKIAIALGAKNAAPASAASALAAQQARFQLVGVLTQGTQKGAALIAVDGKPAKPYAVGATLDADLEVAAVAPRGVSIGKGGMAAFTLTLPNATAGAAAMPTPTTASSLQK